MSRARVRAERACAVLIVRMTSTRARRLLDHALALILLLQGSRLGIGRDSSLSWCVGSVRLSAQQSKQFKWNGVRIIVLVHVRAYAYAQCE